MVLNKAKCSLKYPAWGTVYGSSSYLSHYQSLFQSIIYIKTIYYLYLKGSKTQLDVQSGRNSSGLRQEGEHCVVHPEQRDEEQGGFSQPPEVNNNKWMIKTKDRRPVMWRRTLVLICHHYLLSSNFKKGHSNNDSCKFEPDFYLFAFTICCCCIKVVH